MLIIRPRAEGSGIFDLIAKATNSALAKKIITTAVNKATNSTLAKKVADLGVTWVLGHGNTPFQEQNIQCYMLVYLIQHTSQLLFHLLYIR